MHEKIDISINGDENSKSEIVYNNVIQGLDQDQQVKYLKNKVTTLELEMKNKLIALILFLIVLVGFSIGIYFLILDLYLLGTIVIFLTFIGVMIRFYMMYKAILKVTHSMEFDKIEHLRKILNMRLK
jgi:cobalamin biosynthesis protein CobD/CbiB